MEQRRGQHRASAIRRADIQLHGYQLTTKPSQARAVSPGTTPVRNPLLKLQHLTQPGIIGHFKTIEFTNLFATSPEGAPENLLSVVVAEPSPESQACGYLGERRRLHSVPGWVFGLYRYSLPISHLLPAATGIVTEQHWSPDGKKPLSLPGLSHPIWSFVSAVQTRIEVPAITSALKNNFWNGSHVLEFRRSEPSELAQRLIRGGGLLELTHATPEVPFDLVDLSDRLGGAVIQLPVTAVQTDYSLSQDPAGVLLRLTWHPDAEPRPLQVICRRDYEGCVHGLRTQQVDQRQTLIELPDGPGRHECILIDPETQIILGSSGPLWFLREVHVNTALQSIEPRKFREAGASTADAPVTVDVNHWVLDSRGGRPSSTDWTRDRVDSVAARELARTNHFYQYIPAHDQVATTRRRALEDLRRLIDEFGRHAVCLWDPFLKADDLINTLFHCSHADSELRAITDGATAPDDSVRVQRSFDQGVEAQALETSLINRAGLKLEFRQRSGVNAPSFHDRFLIFPRAQARPLAWSLGTSVNSVGTKHHIVQKVDDGLLVLDAFNQLWDQLGNADCQIWKSTK